MSTPGLTSTLFTKDHAGDMPFDDSSDKSEDIAILASKRFKVDRVGGYKQLTK
jgi:hypothetical protein